MVYPKIRIILDFLKYLRKQDSSKTHAKSQTYKEKYCFYFCSLLCCCCCCDTQLIHLMRILGVMIRLERSHAVVIAVVAVAVVVVGLRDNQAGQSILKCK